MDTSTQIPLGGSRRKCLALRESGWRKRLRIVLLTLLSSMFTLSGGYANQDRMGNDPRSLEYNREYRVGNFEEAERIMRELHNDYPEDATPKIELALLLLKKDGKVYLCEAIRFLEEAILKGEIFFSRKILDQIYAGNWSIVATIEGSEVAQKFLSEEIRKETRALGVPGLDVDDVIGLDDIDRIPHYPVLCDRQGG